jgi:hypothetical protein
MRNLHTGENALNSAAVLDCPQERTMNAKHTIK